MSGEALISAADVARLAGVGRAAVSNWRRRYPDFPEPVNESGATWAFRRDDIERWLRDQGKLVRESDAAALWRMLDPLRGEASPIDSVAGVAEYLADETAVNTLEEPVREILDNLTDDPAELVEQLCTQVFDRQQLQALVTPQELARLMVEIAQPAETVFDPTCGAGNILKAAAEQGAARLFGQEIDRSLDRLARARLALTDKVQTAEVAGGDSLRADAYADLRADAVVCDPPFGLRDWGHDELGVDPRWEYGFPLKGEPELAWMQHCLARAKPGGSVVIAVPAGVAFRRSGRAIRQSLVRRGALRAVLALPAGVLRSTGIPIHLWVLRNSEEPGGSVLLVDASAHQPSRRGKVDWQAIRKAVLGPWRRFVETGEVATVAGQHGTVEAIELLDEEVDLTPARHLPTQAGNMNVAELNSTKQTFASLLSDLGVLLPEMREGAAETRRGTTLNDLARAGALTLHQQVRGLELGDESAAGPLVLTGRDVATGQPASARLPGPAGPEAVWLSPGDLVVPMVAAGSGRSAPRVINEEGLVLGPNLHLIRVDPGKIDVEFLAGHLRSGQARASNSTLSGVHRLDVRRAEIPMLELDQQRELGEAFRRIAAFGQGVRTLAESGTELAANLTDALAAGVALPDKPQGRRNT